MENRFGALKPKVDLRDYKLSSSSIKSQLFPEKFECTGIAIIKNQQSVLSCVAHATSSILEYYSLGNILSTNFIYGIQKEICGHDGSGMYLRDACSIVQKYGDMFETDCTGNNEVPECWKIAESAFEDEEKALRAHYNKIDEYVSLKTVDEIKRFLLSYGPVLGNVYWRDSYKPDKDGVLTGDRNCDGGYHCIMIYGWDEKGFLCQNSWGESWGNKGRFILPYDIELAEAFGLVDDKTLSPDSIIKPRRNWLLDILYKIVNFIINLFKK